MRIALLSSVLLAASCAPRVPPPPAAPPAPAPKPAPVALTPGAKAAPPIPKEAKPWSLPGGARVDVKLALGTVIAAVSPRHFGNNLAWYDGKAWLKSSD